jgi:hypothetical protein
MAKTNSARQAEFRARMREDGKRALHIWVTPQQATRVQAVVNPGQSELAKPLRVTKSTVKSAPVSDSLPAIPTNAPASIARQLKEAQTMRKKKLTQIDKLRKDIDGIESWYRQTVAACKHL